MLTPHRLSLSLLWFAAAVPMARAQAVYGTVRGLVTDSRGASGAGARVTLAGTSFAATADREGRYRLDHVPGGDYVLHVRFADSSTFDVSIRVPAGGTVQPDSLVSHALFSGDQLEQLPVDDPRQAFVLVPGVIERGNDVGIGAGAGLSIRGGPPGEASVYIDGAPVRSQTLGIQQVALGINAIADATVTTGVPGILTGDARGGVITYATRSGGPKLAGNLRADTDGPFGAGTSVGFNRFEAAVGGPFPGTTHLSWFLSGTLLGQSSRYRGLGAADQPSYTIGGVDTTVQWVDFGGQTQSVTLPQFVQSSGLCDAGSNFGFECRGLRRPFDWSTVRTGQGKLVYAYGAGSSIAVTGLLSDQQQRVFPGQVIGDPALYQGARSSSGLVVLNWSQELRPLRGGPLTLSANLSLGTDRQLAGPLDPASETATRDPALGIEFSALHFTGQDSLPFPLNEGIIRNIRSNAGLRVPFLGRTDLRNVQAYRLNPFGVVSGWPTAGLDSRLSMVWERRLNGQVVLAGRRGSHALSLGSDLTRTDASFYQSALISQTGFDAFLVHPRRFGLLVGDRFEASRLVIDAGVRFDHFATGSELSNTPGRIFTDPSWSPSAGTSDTAYVNSLARVFTPMRTQGFWSPRVRVTYAASSRTGVRMAAGRQVQAPPFDLLFKGSNNDLAFTSAAERFGRDLPFAVSTQLELGIHHAPSDGVDLDVAGYSVSRQAPYAGRFASFPDPANPGNDVTLDVVTPIDRGSVTGLNARVDWSPGAILNATLSYSFAHEPGQTVLGGTFFGDATTTHAVAALATLRPPGRWLRGLEASMLVRATSGVSYFTVQNLGRGVIAPGEPVGAPTGMPKLPWLKTVDFRVTRGIHTGRLEASLYADVRNLLGFTNLLGAYAETGSTRNTLYRQSLLAPELASVHFEAIQNGAVQGDGSTVDVRGCAAWYTPPNCVALQRVERRFGNGDGLYSLSEQTAALNSYFDSFFGPWRFAGPGRTARVGLQIRF